MSALPVRLILDSLSAAAEQALTDRPLPTDELGRPQTRRMQGALAKKGYDAENHTVTMSVSSETPISRYGGFEVLSHAAGAIDTGRLDGGIALLYNHDWDVLLGRSTGYQIKGGELFITNRFGSNPDAKQREQDVADGILVDVSIGYQPTKVDITEDKQGVRTYNVTNWELFENSLVTVPADYSVGVNRSASQATEVVVTFRKLDDDPPPAERKADPDDDEDGDDDEEGSERSLTPPAATTSSAPANPESTSTQPTQQRTQPTMEPTTVGPDLAAQRLERQNAIFALRNLHPTHYPDADLQRDLSSEEGVGAIATRLANAVIAANSAHTVRSVGQEFFAGMSERDQNRYSFRNAVCSVINQAKPGTFKDKGSEAGLEREVSDEMKKRLNEIGASGFGAGLILLNDRPTKRSPEEMQQMQQRALTAGGNLGANTINTVTEGSLIEYLYARNPLVAMGCTVMSGVQGLLRLPRQNASASSQWLVELQGGSNSDAGFDSISFTPKRNTIFGSYTIESLAQSAISVEATLRADQLRSKSLTRTAVALIGTGANGMPLGLFNRTGLASVLPGNTRAANGTVTAGQGGVPLTYVDCNAFESSISNLNADTDTPAWLFTPKVRAALRTTPKFPGTGGYVPIWPDGPVKSTAGIQEGPLGYNAGITTNGLPTTGTVTYGGNTYSNLHAAILGIWSSLMFVDWGVSELVYDNITGAPQGVYNVIEHELMDINVRHIEQFVASTTIFPS